MNEVYPGETRYILEAFVIAERSIEFFDLGKSPICRESLALGKAPVTEKGFFITEACIGCGTCASLCPQQCVEDGTPYVMMRRIVCTAVCAMRAVLWRQLSD